MAVVEGGQTLPELVAAHPTSYEAERRRPSLLLEQRAPWELVELLISPVYYGVGIPRGNGSPVLLIPGFLGNDNYLRVMHSWLRRIGYQPQNSQVLINAGDPIDILGHLLHRVDEIHEASGERMTIIGHSMGGLVGRALGTLRQDAVKHVIGLGAPLSRDAKKAADPFVAGLASLFVRSRERYRDPELAKAQEALIIDLATEPVDESVALTTIASLEDPIVPWWVSIDEDERSKVIRLRRGTHGGLAWNARAYHAVGSRLRAA